MESTRKCGEIWRGPDNSLMKLQGARSKTREIQKSVDATGSSVDLCQEAFKSLCAEGTGQTFWAAVESSEQRSYEAMKL